MEIIKYIKELRRKKREEPVLKTKKLHIYNQYFTDILIINHLFTCVWYPGLKSMVEWIFGRHYSNLWMRDLSKMVFLNSGTEMEIKLSQNPFSK